MTDITHTPDTQNRSLINRMWSTYMRPYRKTLFTAFLVMIVQAATVSAYGLLLKYIIDYAQSMPSIADAQGNADPAAAAKRFALAIVPFVMTLTVLSGMSLYIGKILTNKVALGTIKELQKDMFASTHRADYADLTREPVGTLISKFTNDVNILMDGLLRTFNNLFRDILTLLGIVGTMFYLDWVLASIMVLIYPLAVHPIVKISKILRGNSADAQSHIGVMTSELTESLSGARMVKTYSLEQSESTRLNKSFTKRAQLYLKLVSNRARLTPILEVLGGLAISGVFVAGLYRIVDDASTAGDIVGVMTLLLTATPRVRALGTLNNVLQESVVAMNRVFSVIDLRPTIVNAKHAKPLALTGGDIQLSHVGFEYNMDAVALTDISFTAKAGQTLALVGPSGGGKSTIINLIPRLYEVSSGAVKIDGQDIKDITLSSLRSNIALVSQDITLFNDSVAANIAFGRLDATREEIKRAAISAAADDFIKALPQGYDTVVGEHGGTLSGGQRQRIALARAILRDAPILLLDEATSALDAESEAKVQAALEALSRGRTTLVIAHKLATVRSADMIIVLEDGKIVETGKHDSLVANNGLYARLCRLQFS